MTLRTDLELGHEMECGSHALCVGAVAVDTVGRQALIKSAFMTFEAIERPMRSTQGEVGYGMFEIGVFPELLLMARAALGKGPVMYVVLLMTKRAVLAHSTQSSSVQMAFVALQTVVDTGEREVLVEIPGDFPLPLGVAFRAF